MKTNCFTCNEMYYGCAYFRKKLSIPDNCLSHSNTVTLPRFDTLQDRERYLKLLKDIDEDERLYK